MSFFKSSGSPASQADGSKSQKNLRLQQRQRQEHYGVKRNTSFTMDEVDEFRQAFDFYDVTHSKTIDFKDLERALRSLGFYLTPPEMERLLSLLDVDGDTTLDFSEFCMVIECVRREKGDSGDLRDSFRVLDHNKDGYVQVEDLVTLLTTKGENKLSQKEASELIKFADKENTGRINYDDFVDELMKIESETSLNPLHNSENSDLSVNDSMDPQKSHDNYRTAIEDKRKRKPVFENPRCIELVDSIDKALGGPILLASAIIIKHGQCPIGPKDKV